MKDQIQVPNHIKVKAHFLHTEQKKTFKDVAQIIVTSYPELDLKLSALDVSIMWQEVESAKDNPKNPSYIFRKRFVPHNQNGKPLKTKKAPQKEKPRKTAATDEQIKALLNKCW